MKNFLLKVLVVMAWLFAASSWGFASDKTLTAQLAEKARLASKKSPKAKKKIMLQAIEELRKSKILQSAVKTGQVAPTFSLQDFKNQQVQSKELLKKGPMVLIFYRGGWCPYCNLQLRDIEKYREAFQKLGAQVVAISPERPDKSVETVKKQKLSFTVLSDPDGKVGDAFGLMYRIPDSLHKLYKGFGVDLEKQNANNKRELPIAATYIVNTKGRVVYDFLNVDYKKRSETTDILSFLKNMKASGH